MAIRRNRTRAIAALAVTGLVAAAPLAATSSPGPEHRLVGEVLQVDPDERSFAVKETLKRGPTHAIRFVLADDGKVRIRGKEAALADVSPGDVLTVRYIEVDGRLVARELDVAKPP